MLARRVASFLPSRDQGALAAALAIAGTSVWLGTHAFRLGPSDWDDAMYCDRAALDEVNWGMRNRYVHIWGIRLFEQLIASRGLAAALYASAVFGALLLSMFFVGRRLGGRGSGLLAMLLTALFPPVLKYLSVPHVDLPLALYGLLGVASAVACVEASEPRTRFAAALASGLTCYLALKTKETGLVVAPLALYLLFDASAPRSRTYASWGFGFLLGFGALRVLDHSFAPHAGVSSSNLFDYFASAAASTGPAPKVHNKFSHDFVSELTRAPVFAFTLAGLAGFAHGFLTDRMTKALGLWLLGTLLFTACVTWFFTEIDIQDRYLMPIGVALAPLGAAWLTQLWRRQRAPGATNLLWLGPLLLVLLGFAWLGIGGADLYLSGAIEQRAAIFLLPLAMLVLFLTPWLTTAPRLPALACVLLFALSASGSWVEASNHRRWKRAALEPWLELAQRIDQSSGSVALFQPKKINSQRVRWRLHATTSRPIAEIALHNLSDPKDAQPGDLIMTGIQRNPLLEAAGWQRTVTGDWPDPWALYERR